MSTAQYARTCREENTGHLAKVSNQESIDTVMVEDAGGHKMLRDKVTDYRNGMLLH